MFNEDPRLPSYVAPKPSRVNTETPLSTEEATVGVLQSDQACSGMRKRKCFAHFTLDNITFHESYSASKIKDSVLKQKAGVITYFVPRTTSSNDESKSDWSVDLMNQMTVAFVYSDQTADSRSMSGFKSVVRMSKDLDACKGCIEAVVFKIRAFYKNTPVIQYFAIKDMLLRALPLEGKNFSHHDLLNNNWFVNNIFDKSAPEWKGGRFEHLTFEEKCTHWDNGCSFSLRLYAHNGKDFDMEMVWAPMPSSIMDLYIAKRGYSPVDQANLIQLEKHLKAVAKVFTKATMNGERMVLPMVLP